MRYEGQRAQRGDFLFRQPDDLLDAFAARCLRQQQVGAETPVGGNQDVSNQATRPGRVLSSASGSSISCSQPITSRADGMPSAHQVSHQGGSTAAVAAAAWLLDISQASASRPPGMSSCPCLSDGRSQCSSRSTAGPAVASRAESSVGRGRERISVHASARVTDHQPARPRVPVGKSPGRRAWSPNANPASFVRSRSARSGHELAVGTLHLGVVGKAEIIEQAVQASPRPVGGDGRMQHARAQHASGK